MTYLYDAIKLLFAAWLIGMIIYGCSSVDNKNVYEALVWPYAAVLHVQHR